jgi:hypothetical protein
LCEDPFEVAGQHPTLIVGRDRLDPLSPEPEHPARDRHRDVTLLAGDHPQLGRPLQAVRLDVPARPVQNGVSSRR